MRAWLMISTRSSEYIRFVEESGWQPRVTKNWLRHLHARDSIGADAGATEQERTRILARQPLAVQKADTHAGRRLRLNVRPEQRKLPVVFVSRADASAYCAHIGARLPRELDALNECLCLVALENYGLFLYHP